jgi:hypothetical protein
MKGIMSVKRKSMVDYKDVLNDLEERKSAIETAIRVIRSLFNGHLPACDQQDETPASFHSVVSELTSGANQDVPKIQQEDIVECVTVRERDPGTDADLIPVIGKEYRVIKTVKRGNTVEFYEVLDDSAGTKIRMPLFYAEVKLKRKHVPSPPRVVIPSIIKRCLCGEDNALLLTSSGNYHGNCEKCGLKMEDHVKEEHNGIGSTQRV